MKKIVLTLAAFSMALAPSIAYAYQEPTEQVELEEGESGFLIALLAAAAVISVIIVAAGSDSDEPVSP